jgi:SAM-dependent methyltransferase
LPECQLRLTWAAAAPDWRPMTASWLPGVHPSPNIQADPEVDEIENRAADPEGRLEQAMWQIAPWQGEVVLDLGAGTGFHLERFHHDAQQVIAVEPDGRLRLRAMQRVAGLGLERASVLAGSAERLLLADHSVGIAHARFAYFFGPGSEPGLAELARVLRPGGTAFIVDNDWRTGTLRPGWPARRGAAGLIRIVSKPSGTSRALHRRRLLASGALAAARTWRPWLATSSHLSWPRSCARSIAASSWRSTTASTIGGTDSMAPG